MNKLLATKAGRMLDAMKKWKGLPNRVDRAKYVLWNKFEKGLKDYLEKTCRRSYVALKNEL